MNKLTKELKQVMKEKGLSREKASRFLGCSAMTIHRWFNNSHSPSLSSNQMIKEGIAKIKKAYPEIKETGATWNLMQKAKGFWPRVKQQLTFEERAELLEIQNSKPLEAYIERLQELVEKYEK